MRYKGVIFLGRVALGCGTLYRFIKVCSSRGPKRYKVSDHRLKILSKMQVKPMSSETCLVFFQKRKFHETFYLAHFSSSLCDFLVHFAPFVLKYQISPVNFFSRKIQDRVHQILILPPCYETFLTCRCKFCNFFVRAFLGIVSYR